jgi:replicative DNA helicase
LAARIPPHNLEAEQSILGALMLDRECWDAVAEVIEADDFYRPHHQKIFQIISELQKKNLPVDIITVSNLLQSQNQMAEAGGTDYLIEVLNKTISSANIQHYASIVKEKSKLRKLIQTSTQIIEKSYEQDFKDIDSFIDQVEADFFKLGENKKSEGLIGSMEIVKASLMRIEELYKKQAEITGLATGFTELDKMTSGLQPGELTIIAARPSMGKTAFSLNLAQHVALRQKKSVAYFSLERYTCRNTVIETLWIKLRYVLRFVLPRLLQCPHSGSPFFSFS